jgi:hypothetical protein
MRDNRGPKTRFFDDVTDLSYAAQVAYEQLAGALDRHRAIEFDREREAYTLVFQSRSLDCLLFVVRDLEDRARSLNERAEQLFDGVDLDECDARERS